MADWSGVMYACYNAGLTVH